MQRGAAPCQGEPEQSPPEGRLGGAVWCYHTQLAAFLFGASSCPDCTGGEMNSGRIHYLATGHWWSVGCPHLSPHACRLIEVEVAKDVVAASTTRRMTHGFRRGRIRRGRDRRPFDPAAALHRPPPSPRPDHPIANQTPATPRPEVKLSIHNLAFARHASPLAR